MNNIREKNKTLNSLSIFFLLYICSEKISLTWLTNWNFSLFFNGFVVNKVVNQKSTDFFSLLTKKLFLTFFLVCGIFLVKGVVGMNREELDNNSNVDLSKLPANKRHAIEKAKNSRGTYNNNKSATSYLSQPNVQEFNRAIQKKIFNSSGLGRPYAFSSIEQLQQDMGEFFELCANTQTVPTITSLALWLGVDKTTIYEHANNSNSPFSTILKNTLTYCHSVMQNGTVEGKINPVTYIFISKNDYGMRDDKNITVSATQGSNVNTEETANALRKQIEEETTPNATLVSEE